MKRRGQQQESGGGAADWMTTYSDLVTLLFTFFVLLFAISQVDAQKFTMLAYALANKGATAEQIMEIGKKYEMENTDDIDFENPKVPLPLGEDKESPLEEAYESIVEHIEQSGAAGKVEISLGDEYIFIRFVDEMLFDPNSYAIRQSDYTFLGLVGSSLLEIQDDVSMIRIDGHTAAILENDNYPVSDRDLSSERANAVVKFFESEVGIQGEKLTAFSFGKYRPVADNSTEEGRKKNRRIEILVTKGDSIAVQLDNIYEKMLD